jgi:lipid-A-disaccharide synthase
MPNILANQMIMPEYIQSQVDSIKMGEKIAEFLKEPNNYDINQCIKLHGLLKCNASVKAAEAIYNLLKEK